jgi:chemotaxis family two-component system response regulator Rcp1
VKQRVAEVLLVDDNPGDIDLTREALQAGDHPVHLVVAVDGTEALARLREEANRSVPGIELVILDLNLPRMDGRAVLSTIRRDARFRKLPVVIFTTSQAARDIDMSYELGANAYLSKPGNLREFMSAVDALARFWLKVASLPTRGTHG